MELFTLPWGQRFHPSLQLPLPFCLLCCCLLLLSDGTRNPSRYHSLRALNETSWKGETPGGTWGGSAHQDQAISLRIFL